MDEVAFSLDKAEENVDATIHFLARLPLYDSVKPYTIRYDTGGDFPATNVENEHHHVKIRNMRCHNLSYEKCGFQFCNMSSAMKYEDYGDPGLVKAIHFPEVEACLKKVLRASFVQIINVQQRKRHNSFPIATGEAYEYVQPTIRAHLDYSLESAQDIIRGELGSRAEIIMGRRWQYVNVWHPIRGPLYDWPLAVCDASSVDFDTDTMAADVVEETGDSLEILQVFFNRSQEWYYLPGQLPSEMLIFKNVDSRSSQGATPGTPHAAFDLMTKPPSCNDFHRESIEMRAVVAW
ncbi:methyltransferase [Rhizodiscina lignyota]|uniref:Methyltransferase n=1 Tax=Rhizodiscina lignyota TaxID=1504668 RepID=A0A9P4IJ69_9PEZI|nr:methyltransferase [Rhizodiscina lignyota]